MDKKRKSQSSDDPMSRICTTLCNEIHLMFIYTSSCTAGDHYLVKYLAFEDFSCMSHKCVALALLAKFIAVLVSIMECFSVPAPNACNGPVPNFLAHFLLYVVDIPRGIKTLCTECIFILN